MHPLECPVCKQQAMSASAKLNIGPLKFKPCRSCGQSLSVPWRSYVLVGLTSSLLPFVGLLLAISVTSSMLIAMFGLVLAAIPALWLHYRLVPLVARSSPSSGQRRSASNAKPGT
jgi:hypothetical protein